MYKYIYIYNIMGYNGIYNDIRTQSQKITHMLRKYDHYVTISCYDWCHSVTLGLILEGRLFFGHLGDIIHLDEFQEFFAFCESDPKKTSCGEVRGIPLWESRIHWVKLAETGMICMWNPVDVPPTRRITLNIASKFSNLLVTIIMVRLKLSKNKVTCTTNKFAPDPSHLGREFGWSHIK